MSAHVPRHLSVLPLAAVAAFRTQAAEASRLSRERDRALETASADLSALPPDKLLALAQRLQKGLWEERVRTTPLARSWAAHATRRNEMEENPSGEHCVCVASLQRGFSPSQDRCQKVEKSSSKQIEALIAQRYGRGLLSLNNLQWDLRLLFSTRAFDDNLPEENRDKELSVPSLRFLAGTTQC